MPVALSLEGENKFTVPAGLFTLTRIRDGREKYMAMPLSSNLNSVPTRSQIKAANGHSFQVSLSQRHMTIMPLDSDSMSLMRVEVRNMNIFRGPLMI